MATQGRSQRANEPNKKTEVFRDFKALNTQAVRQAIERGEFSWLENMIPIGHGNLKVLANRSAALASIGANHGTIFYMHSFNIENTPCMFVATDTGNAYQILDESPNTVTTISQGANEFDTSRVSVAQWQNSILLILDSKGYRSWDGTNLVHIGCVNATTVTSGGAGIGSATVTFGTPNETGGIQATGHVVIAAGVVTQVVIDEPGSGYTAPPSVTITPNVSAATATCTILNPTGQNVQTYAGRAWLTNNRTFLYSAPPTQSTGYENFQTGQGAGSFIVTDETLLSSVIALLSANNFLYWTGESSVNAIGDVQVITGPTTVFSDPNLSDNIGSSTFYGAVISYYRSILMMNGSGVYSLFGAMPQKMSDALDGVLPLIDQTMPVWAGVVTIENQLCAAFFFTYRDPAGPRPLMAVFFNKKWFLASQGNDLVAVCGAYDGIAHRLYGTDGVNFYELFVRDDLPTPWKFSLSFWDAGALQTTKEASGFGFEINSSASVGTITFKVDTLNDRTPYTDSQTYDIPVSSFASWVNNANAAVTWQNNALAPIDWLGESYLMRMQDMEIDGGGAMYGKYIGLGMSSSDVIGTISSLMLQYKLKESW